MQTQILKVNNAFYDTDGDLFLVTDNKVMGLCGLTIHKHKAVANNAYVFEIFDIFSEDIVYFVTTNNKDLIVALTDCVSE